MSGCGEVEGEDELTTRTRRARTPPSWAGPPKETRTQKLYSKGWRAEALPLLDAARAKGVCAQCAKPLHSKYPVGDSRRRSFCHGDKCSDLFYERHFQSWAVAKRAVSRRVKAANGGEIRCENCGAKPEPIRKPFKWDGSVLDYEAHCGYEYDHRAEIAAGGDPFDPDNIWILCLHCHHAKTAGFLKRRTPSVAPPLLRRLDEFASQGEGDARGARDSSSSPTPRNPPSPAGPGPTTTIHLPPPWCRHTGERIGLYCAVCGRRVRVAPSSDGKGAKRGKA